MGHPQQRSEQWFKNRFESEPPPPSGGVQILLWVIAVTSLPAVVTGVGALLHLPVPGSGLIMIIDGAFVLAPTALVVVIWTVFALMSGASSTGVALAWLCVLLHGGALALAFSVAKF